MAGNLAPRGDNISTVGTLIKRYIKGFFYSVDVKSGANAPIKTLQRSTAYVIGDVVTTDALHAKYYLKCTTAGTTGSSEPSFTGATSNSTVTDGTAVWTVQTITSAEEVSSSVANTYAPKESPAFTGNPTAPTQTSTDNSTKVATTAFVQGNLANYAPLASPALTGNPTAPTQLASDSSTKVATTSFVHGHTDDKAPIASPAFTGSPTAPTQTATDDSTKIATTAFVHDNTDDKAPLDSPALTGNPTAPTQATTDNSTKIATTAYVKGNLASYAPLANPALTGSPTAPTQTATDDSTKIATTAFVKSNVPASVGSATKHVYTDSNGKIVASNSTVGGSDTPVYLNGGTITAAAKYIPVQSNAGYHNSIYRGKSLGASVTSAQWTSIKAGTFDDLFIGDYWTINSVNWRIAAFDYWVNCGDTNTTAHHVVIVPDSNLASCKMNDTNITTGAYIGSDYYTGNNSNTGKATAQTAINNAFGAAHILSHREYLQNAVSNGRQSAGAWYDSTFELMNEHMVYGGKVFEATSDGTNVPNVYTIDKSQLPLFALEPSRITNRATWWLRSVVSAAAFADVTSAGVAYYYTASYSYGVRPAFAIYQS